MFGQGLLLVFLSDAKLWRICNISSLRLYFFCDKNISLLSISELTVLQHDDFVTNCYNFSISRPNLYRLGWRGMSLTTPITSHVAIQNGSVSTGNPAGTSSSERII